MKNRRAKTSATQRTGCDGVPALRECAVNVVGDEGGPDCHRLHPVADDGGLGLPDPSHQRMSSGEAHGGDERFGHTVVRVVDRLDGIGHRGEEPLRLALHRASTRSSRRG